MIFSKIMHFKKEKYVPYKDFSDTTMPEPDFILFSNLSQIKLSNLSFLTICIFCISLSHS